MSPSLAAAAEASVAYLQSDAARASIAKDPYWPKWNSPWWHVLALREAGFEPPREAVAELVRASERHYLTFFPKSEAELPPGKSLRTDVMCFCGLGCLLQAAEGIASISWADDYLARYQAEDGGWNCDERGRVSSVVSTVPVLEYLVGKPGLSADERARLDRGMRFLLTLRLFRSRRTGAVLNEAWLRPSLPRFYEYDVLRGLSLVARWVARTGAPVPRAEIAEALALGPGEPRSWPLSDGARVEHRAESSFPLLEALAAEGPRRVAEQWAGIRAAFG